MLTLEARADAILSDFYEQLRQRGKVRKVAPVTVTWKLLLRLNAVAGRGTPWRANCQAAV